MIAAVGRSHIEIPLVIGGVFTRPGKKPTQLQWQALMSCWCHAIEKDASLIKEMAAAVAFGARGGAASRELHSPVITLLFSIYSRMDKRLTW